MSSFVPNEPDQVLDTAAAAAWSRAMALTIGQMQPRSLAEPAEVLPVAEVQEMAWEDWCAASTASPPL